MKLHRKLVLASKSPRRKELLSLITNDFEVRSKEVNEYLDPDNLEDSIKELAYLKAAVIFDKESDEIVIASDTIVVCDNILYGKPKDYGDAFQMIKTLSNRSHKVITAVCILSKERKIVFNSKSKVFVNKIEDDEIKEYLATRDAYDKAGAYGIQGEFSKFIDHIEGDYYSIMGLPVSKVYKKLKEFEDFQ